MKRCFRDVRDKYKENTLGKNTKQTCWASGNYGWN